MPIEYLQKNSKAFFDYTILDEYECGIVLQGYEIKTISDGLFNLKGSFAKIVKDEVFVFDMHVSVMTSVHKSEVLDVLRPRKLLLHKSQINKLKDFLKKTPGSTLVPLSVYKNENGKCKVLLGMCTGKKLYDKREALKERDLKRESQRASKIS